MSLSAKLLSAKLLSAKSVRQALIRQLQGILTVTRPLGATISNVSPDFLPAG